MAITSDNSDRRPRAETSPWDFIVVVPARNEEQLIGGALASIINALDWASSRLDQTAIVVVADRCTDQTTQIANQILKSRNGSLVWECNAGTVGRAREIGVELGRAGLQGRRSSGVWIASTDADTTVPEDWVVRQLCEADAGFEAIAGTVTIDELSDVPNEVRSRFQATYTDLLPKRGAHGHVHAANMGIRLDAYDHAGGWGRLARSEDRDLWTRLKMHGRSVKATVDLTVTTSGRALGRVPGGFAEFLHSETT
jgi:glycosyltransferase involved in cell wall biosynthesis